MSIYTPQIITADIISRFQPTRLYIKRHRGTGLLYLGKTSRQDIIGYLGSGLHWTRHLGIHGADVDTVWYSDWFVDPADIQDFALLVSEAYDIVHSDKWANMKPENGLDGGRMSDESLATRTTVWGIKVSCFYCRDEHHYPNYVMYHGDYCKSNPDRIPNNRPSAAGAKNGRFISTEYAIYDSTTNLIFYSTKYDLYNKYSLNKGQAQSLIAGEIKSANNLELIDSPSFPDIFHEPIDFHNIYSGETLTCTPAEFWHAGLAKRSVLTRFISGERKHSMMGDWTLSAVSVYNFVNKQSNEEIVTTVHGLAKHTGLPWRVLSRLSKPEERLQSYKGWSIIAQIL